MGMFDTVIFTCPSCLGEIEEQSKAGDCILAEHNQDAVPVAIAAELNGTRIVCPHCGKRMRAYAPIRPTVYMHLDDDTDE